MPRIMLFVLVTICLALSGVSLFAEDYDYNAVWQDLSYIFLRENPETSMARLDSLITAAKAENRMDQQIKGMLFQLYAMQNKQEFAEQKAIHKIREELDTASFPITPILHRMLAQLYLNYQYRHQTRYAQRSEITSENQEDIATWDNNRIAKEIIHQFQLSLQDPELLQAEQLPDYRWLLRDSNDDAISLHPTLYDFLAWDALDHYMQDSSVLSLAVNAFSFDDARYFASAESFAQMPVSSPDSLSYRYLACKLLQDITRFHLHDEDPKVLIDVEIKRLTYIHGKSSLSNKDILYEAALRRLMKHYREHEASAHVALHLAILYHNQGAKADPEAKDETRWKYKAAYEICREAYASYPTSFGGKSCEALMHNITRPYLTLSTEEYYSPNSTIQTLLEVRNVQQVQIRIYRIPYQNITNNRFDDELQTWHNRSRQGSRQSKLDVLLQSPPMWSADYTFEDEGDYRGKSYELALAKLPSGHYLVFASLADSTGINNSQTKAFSIFSISKLSRIHPIINQSEMLIVDRNTGMPIPDAKIQVYRRQQDSQPLVIHWSGQSDQDGKANYIDLDAYRAENWTRRHYRMQITSGADTLQVPYLRFPDAKHNYPGYPRCLMFTDRAIYRPGQTVYVKGVFHDSDGEISHPINLGGSVYLFLQDVNRQPVSNLKNISISEYGSFDASFVIPKDRRTGTWTIGANGVFSNNKRSNGFIEIKVEEYKRPSFEVSLAQPTHSYSLGSQVTLEGHAMSYAGIAIDNANVQYRVSRQAKYPHWYWWWGSRPETAEKEILGGNAVTNADGSFTITFFAEGDPDNLPKYSPFYSYKIEAVVTDLNGETRSGSLSLNIGERDLILSTDVPEYIDKQGSGLQLAISSKNINEEPIVSEGKLSIYLLKHPDHIQKSRLWNAPNRNYLSRSEFRKAFPTSIYGNEDALEKREIAREVYSGAFNAPTQSVIAIKSLSAWPAGSYRLEIVASHNGKDYKEIQYFNVFDSKAKQLPYPMAEYFVPIKVLCEPGAEAQVLIGSGYDNVRVIFEVEKNHQIVESRILNLNREQQLLRVPVTEADRGNFFLHFTFIKDGRLYQRSQQITVPWTNKELKIEYLTFRDKLLPGQEEEWRLKIRDHNGKNVSAEVLASMYDASLDAFYEMTWPNLVYGQRSKDQGWIAPGFTKNVNGSPNKWVDIRGYQYRTIPRMNWHYYGVLSHNYEFYGKLSASEISTHTEFYGDSRVRVHSSMDLGGQPSLSSTGNIVSLQAGVTSADFTAKATDISAIVPRSNFAETAFFYPKLHTDENGEVSFTFTVPESLTRWKFRAFAIADSLRTGHSQNITLTQKPLMVSSNPPRFLRQGDSITLSAKISIMDDEQHSGQCLLQLFDPFTGKALDSLFNLNNAVQTFSLKKGESTVVNWDLKIPYALYAVSFKVLAKSGDFTDGEEHTLPILANRMLVTESLPLPVGGKSTKNYSFEKLKNSASSNTLSHHALSLEYTSNPTWYAVQALPYLMEKCHDSLDETFYRLYANTMASHIVNSNPIYKRIFTEWKNQKGSPALLSNLEKNREFKSIMLQESPWLREAQSESEQKQRIGMLFDTNNISAEYNAILSILEKHQNTSGAWPWFPTGRDSYWTTQNIVQGFGRLKSKDVSNMGQAPRIAAMLNKALPYLDTEIKKRYDYLKEHKMLKRNNLSYMDIQYLYTRSFFSDNPIKAESREAVDYFIDQAKKHWQGQNFYAWGAIALALNRLDESATAIRIVKALKENALYDEELGMYWKAESGWYWYQSPILRQTILIEAFSEITGDTQSVDGLRLWLLKNKQTNNWGNHKATADACFAMLMHGTDWLTDALPVDIWVAHGKLDNRTGGMKIPESTINGEAVSKPQGRNTPNPEAGTGYFKQVWPAAEVTTLKADIKISNPNQGPAWGAMYWQYFEDLDKITAAETPLSLKKALFKERLSDSGPVLDLVHDGNRLQVGDKVVVRIELRTDRDMEYLHLKDMRSSGFEPINVLSGYKRQDGLWYYEATGDAATNFFIESLPKGTYVFEYALRVMQKGDFSNGISSIQCLYAPEYSSHSAGIRVQVSGGR